MTRRMFAAIGTGACVAAVLFAAARLREIDRALGDLTVDTTFGDSE